MHLTEKQYQALQYLEDKTTKEVCFGGGAGGGKTRLGCYWILKSACKYPNTRWLIGRSVLKTLKETTGKSFFEVAAEQGIKSNHYTYNQQSGEFKLKIGSEILFKDLFLYPSDPNMDELGSLELTGTFIDEAIQVKEKVINIVKSRIRYKLDDYNLIPKILYCSNPGRGYLYDNFYKPSLENKLPEDKKFIQSLVNDNRFISEHYISNLNSLDKESKERLLLGNWDFEQEGYVFPEYKINRFSLKDINPRELFLIKYADIADEGICYYSSPLGAIKDGKVYIIDWIYTDKPTEYWFPIEINCIKKNEPEVSYFESNGAGLITTKFLKDKIGKPYSSRMIAIPEFKNKHERIKASGELDVLPNFYFLYENEMDDMYKLAFNHLMQYRYDGTFKIKDGPDSLAGMSKLSIQYRKQPIHA